jgi:probable phosphoglycerate mutase
MGLETFWVRHGQSTWNRAGVMQGQTHHPPLTNLGKRQASAAATALLGHRPVRILSSDLVRASDTARIIADRLRLPVTYTATLRERGWGSYEGRPVAEGLLADSSSGPEHTRPQRESRDAVAHRLSGLLAMLGDTSGPVVVVTHGDVVREAVRLWCVTGQDESLPENGCIVPIVLRSDAGQLVRSSPPIATRALAPNVQ